MMVTTATGSSRLNLTTLPEYARRGELERTLEKNQTYVLEKKYLRRDKDGKVNETVSEAIYRMAHTMASVEKSFGMSDEQVASLTKDFYEMIDSGSFSPAGRIWTNAGTEIGGLFNCYVLPVEDGLEEIYETVKKAALIHKNGGGTGYNFSKLRPRGHFVGASKGIASGPVSFIGQFDKETEIINSGNRRGANMGILNVNHPDILDFVYAKGARGEITNFNVSIGATEEFMLAVENDSFYDLQFPKGVPFRHQNLEKIVANIEESKIGGAEVGSRPKPASLNFDTKEVFPGKTKIIDTQSGKVAGRVDSAGVVQLSAKYVIDVVSELAWRTADPGMIFLDEINRYNPLPQKGEITATNPCGEQPLHPYDACNLGSIILSAMLRTERGKKVVDYEKLEKTVRLATRFMDNVNDANRGPIPEVEKTVLEHRRIGMGVMGWADMLVEMRIPYDSEGGRKVAKEVMGFITDTAKSESVNLAREKGVFLAFKGSKYDNGKLEDRVRNIDRTTIAPTGTIAMVYNASSGIEPLFAITYRKNIRGGDTLLYTVPAFVEECKKRGLDLEKIAPLIDKNHGSVQGIKEIPADMQRIFKTSHDLDYESHVLMQAAFQERVDNAVSKTINMPNSATVQDVRNAYILAWKNNLKGITVYRDGSKEIQVLNTGHADSHNNGNGNGSNGNGKINLEKMVGTIENPLRVPGITPSIKIKQKTPWGNMHVNLVVDPSRQYSPIETFASLGNAGGVEAADIEAMGRLTSLWLRSGGSVESIITQLKSIGSGVSTITRDGSIQSLPMAFARALQKYEIMRKNYNIEEILLGKIDLDQLEGEISDHLRTGRGNGNGNGHTSEFSVASAAPVPIASAAAPAALATPIPEVSSRIGYGGERCPDCSGPLINQEGCQKCQACGFSKC